MAYWAEHIAAAAAAATEGREEGGIVISVSPMNCDVESGERPFFWADFIIGDHRGGGGRMMIYHRRTHDSTLSPPPPLFNGEWKTHQSTFIDLPSFLPPSHYIFTYGRSRFCPFLLLLLLFPADPIPAFFRAHLFGKTGVFRFSFCLPKRQKPFACRYLGKQVSGGRLIFLPR